MKRFGKLSTLALSSAAAALLALAPATQAASEMTDKAAANPDGTWVTFTGTVAEADTTGFVMDYGNHTVYVEVDDWDWYAHGYTGLPGDRVTVSGRVDKDGFEAKKIEAGIVYLHDVFTYHYANPADEEDYAYAVHSFVITPDASSMSVIGTVGGVKGDEFVLRTGFGDVTVETETMPYDPLDDVGNQKLETGDRVSVTGSVGPGSYDGFFEDRELLARNVVTLEENVGS